MNPWTFIAIGVLLLVIAAIAYFASDKTWARIIALVTLIFGAVSITWGAYSTGMFGGGIRTQDRG